MEDLQTIYTILQEAKEYGLETEVILSALQSMKGNPNQSLTEAMHTGMGEWIK